MNDTIPKQVMAGKLGNGRLLSEIYAPEDLWNSFTIADPAAFASVWQTRLRESIEIHRNAELIRQAQLIVTFLDVVGNSPLHSYMFKNDSTTKHAWVIYEPTHNLCLVIESEPFTGRGRR